MGIAIRWDNISQTVIRYEFLPGWDWQDLLAVTEETERLMHEVEHAVHLLFDLQASASVPHGMMMALRRWLESLPANWSGYLVLAGASTYFKRLFQMFTQIYGSSQRHEYFFLFVQLPDDAYRIFEQDVLPLGRLDYATVPVAAAVPVTVPLAANASPGGARAFGAHVDGPQPTGPA